MANRKEPGTEIVAVEKMAEDIQAAEELYSDGMPYELERIENEIRFFQEQTGAALFEMGKRFIRIKAHEGHGGFLKTLENLGTAYRTAAYAMAAARKFSNVPALAHLETSKMKVLTVLADDDIKTLEDGGKVKGKNLDETARMSYREVCDYARGSKKKIDKLEELRKKDREIQEQAIAEKDAKIGDLEQRLRCRQPPTQEQLAIAELSRLDGDYFHELAGAMGALRKAVYLLNTAQCVPGVNVQILSGWIARFNEEMILLNGVHGELAETIDNLHPVVKGGYQTVSGEDAGVSADVPDLG